MWKKSRRTEIIGKNCKQTCDSFANRSLQMVYVSQILFRKLKEKQQEAFGSRKSLTISWSVNAPFNRKPLDIPAQNQHNQSACAYVLVNKHAVVMGRKHIYSHIQHSNKIDSKINITLN